MNIKNYFSNKSDFDKTMIENPPKLKWVYTQIKDDPLTFDLSIIIKSYIDPKTGYVEYRCIDNTTDYFIFDEGNNKLITWRINSIGWYIVFKVQKMIIIDFNYPVSLGHNYNLKTLKELKNNVYSDIYKFHREDRENNININDDSINEMVIEHLINKKAKVLIKTITSE